ncbi:MAG TPA: metal-dependent hydrolase [Vicinamibacterales bacterium]|nr:metal-dependent hydrolase [Vicinamibacterales bacterium]
MRLPSADTHPVSSRAALRGLKVTWLGHSTFLMTSPKGVRLLFDPFLTNNPSCPRAATRVGQIDLILITHGHSDHCEDAAAVARETGATVIASPELSGWLERQGVKHLRPMNIGGRQHLSGLAIAMVPALHSSSAPDGSYLGPATGFAVRFEDGLMIYFAGDTALFGDMRIIRDRHTPDVAFLPIGDRFTMGPEDAAIAAEWVGATAIVPMHYGTFPELTGTVQELRAHAGPRGIEVIELMPGVAVE